MLDVNERRKEIEMRFSRTVAGVRKMDHKSKEDVREELEIISIDIIIKR
jgi:hypothetical protein